MLFLSTYHNRLDKKGRVSIPAQFRAVLAAQQADGIVAYASPINPSIEACGMGRITKFNQRVERFEPYSTERDAFAAMLFGDSVQLSFDTEGRVMLPESLIAFANLSEQVTIVGKGEIFEMWEPKAFGIYIERVRKIVREKRSELKRGRVMHKPVMLEEMINWIAPKDKGTYIDGTFGAGGYSRAILNSADCQVFAIDRDPSTKRFAEQLEHEFPNRFIWLLGNFSDMCSLVSMYGVHEADGIVLDLGISSMQIDQAERGFSFKNDGPLDMRMSGQGLSAMDVVNNSDEKDLADILYYYGEEKQSRRIAHAIVNVRAAQPITTTRQLADIIRGAIGHKPGHKTDPATRSFQGLRIHVNQEFDAIESGLRQAEALLAPGGKLVVVTFHSLEDRIVKRYYHSRCGRLGEQSRHMPKHVESSSEETAPHFFLSKPEKRVASDAETGSNPRARSATMRMMIRREGHVQKASAL